MKRLASIFSVCVFSLLICAGEASAFWHGWWASEDNQKILFLSDKEMILGKETGVVIHNEVIEGKTYIIAMAKSKYEQSPKDFLEKLGTMNLKQKAWYGGGLEIEKISDSELSIKMSMTPTMKYRKISKDEAEKLLSGK